MNDVKSAGKRRVLCHAAVVSAMVSGELPQPVDEALLR